VKIGFVVNDIGTEKAGYTTTYLAMAASRMGHQSWYISLSDLCYGPGDHIHATARKVKETNHRLSQAYLNDLRSGEAVCEFLDVSDLDVLMLRNDPAEDVMKRPWARLAGINFGRFAASRGVLVVNDPDGLSRAVNKLYLQEFPAEVRPRAFISRDRAKLKAFCKEMGGTVVLKPLFGSGGRNVFLVRPDDAPNVNQIIEAVSRDGFIIAQEYLPEVVHGDIRLFLLNGKPLGHKQHYACIRRLRNNEDIRSNMTAGATSAPATMNDDMRHLADCVGPKLVRDGMFLVGLDIVGDKLTEINVFSPGGLESAENFSGVRFSRMVIEDLERKLELRKNETQALSNQALAAL
jgi:glutathione synthase